MLEKLEEVRVRIANFPLERSLRQINARNYGTMTSVSGGRLSEHLKLNL